MLIFVYTQNSDKYSNIFNHKWETHKQCAEDSNLEPQDSRRRRIDWAMAAPRNLDFKIKQSGFKLETLKLFLSLLLAQEILVNFLDFFRAIELLNFFAPAKTFFLTKLKTFLRAGKKLFQIFECWFAKELTLSSYALSFFCFFVDVCLGISKVVPWEGALLWLLRSPWPIEVVHALTSRSHLLLCFCLFNTVDSKQKMTDIKVCRRLDSNRGPLASEATTLPTEPHLTNRLLPPTRTITKRCCFIVHLFRSVIDLVELIFISATVTR